MSFLGKACAIALMIMIIVFVFFFLLAGAAIILPLIIEAIDDAEQWLKERKDGRE
ncbi:MAG: hypothetical protein IJ091_01810 [Oscillospiraceae bacterium]|nr:hypothetical protein [Oscillospiraceae bacterium]